MSGKGGKKAGSKQGQSSLYSFLRPEPIRESEKDDDIVIVESEDEEEENRASKKMRDDQALGKARLRSSTGMSAVI